ncbi:MAG TPA: glycosyltransferase family 39 protein [Chloroflexia bacterium]|nr:glycosyltransferase family 39 protein [Chloroflexia bacterium]
MTTAVAANRLKVRTPVLGAVAWGRADVRNIVAILLGFACVLLLVSPARSYPVTDDWIYWQSVGDLLRIDYAPHDWTQPIALGHLAWGALFAALFGHTFTVLTLSNLVMSVACLVIFYLLLRHLDIAPTYALLGTATLGFNPIYLFLTYSFMTDVTFLVYTLGACLCYIRGVQGYGERWLWLGGLATALAYLTRQYGVLIVVAALAFLLLSRRWSWRSALAIAAIPIMAAVSYSVWGHFQPAPLINLQMDAVNETRFQHFDRYLTDRGFRIAWLLTSLGLSLLPLMLRARRPLISLPLFAFLLYFQFQSATIFGSFWPSNGNIIDITGYIFYAYDAAAIWTRWVWLALGVLGMAAFSLQFAFYAERAWVWLRARPWRDPASIQVQDPALILYILGLMLAGVVFLLTPFLFDRYWLALLPILCVPPLRQMSAQGAEVDAPASTKPAWPRWALLAPLALFSLVAMRDYKEHAGTRWSAAESLVARGIRPDQMRAGYEWDGFYNFKAGAQRIRDTGDFTNLNYPPGAVIDPVYIVSDLPISGYREIDSIPYHSWLEGGVTRSVLVLQRK